MSVLRKKIEQSAVLAPLNEEGVKSSWVGTQSLILESLETLLEPLHWKSASIDIKQLSAKELAKAFPKTGLYTALGETDREAKCALLFDTKLAALITKFGFEGRITELKSINKYTPTRFDIMMMDSLIQDMRKVLDNPILTSRTDYMEFSDIPLSQDHDGWVKLDINYTISLGPKSESVPIVLSLLILQSDIENSLKTNVEPHVKEEPIHFDDAAESLTRHIDLSATSLRAILESCEMTVADCTRLAIGQVIPLPGVSLQELRVEAELADSRICIARAALGIHKTRRAVQLIEDIAPSFIDQEQFSTVDV